MRRPRRRNHALVYALYVNAAALLAILVLLLTRGGPGGAGTALAAGPQMQPIAGGGGLYLMPAQFSMNTWGCYVMDTDAQTICAYQYHPSQNQLRLAASRHFRHDRMLKNYNTWPSPKEIQHLIDVEKAGLRGQENDPAKGAEPQPEPSPAPGGAADPVAPAGPPQIEPGEPKPGEPKPGEPKPGEPVIPPLPGAGDPDREAVRDSFQQPGR